ncbi:MAG: HAMP domain-containing histidine kinase [Erysipelotrichaceae bacterium]|nr:HAMP domain-containing histidine kinase [Erysipelotrichaceae bacterium]
MPEKKKTLSIFGRIMVSMIAFVIILVSVLWIAQIGFLEKTYASIRSSQVRKLTESVEKLINYNNIESTVLPAEYESNIGIIIEDRTAGIQYRTDTAVRSQIFGRYQEQKIRQLLLMTDDSDRKTYFISSQRGERLFDDPEIKISEDYDDVQPNAVAYVIKTEHLGSEYTIIGLGQIMPVNATVDALRTQLTYITIAFSAFAIILAYFISRAIAKPLVNLNESAARLATGNYDIQFHGTGFTEVEELSDTLNFTARELKKSDQLTKDLIANISHDLRTPLTMISGYGELMRDIPGEASPENIQVIIDEANRLTKLVNGMLDISKLQAGTADITRAAVNASELVVKVADTYSTLMENSGYRFVVDCDEDIYVNGDGERLQQVLHNLISNAINHIGEDKTVIVSCHRKNDVVRFDVIDHGTGIKKEDLPLVWNRYYRINKTRDTGSGLGLSIVKTILELHNAAYGVDSEVGKGSDFWFELPLMGDN